MSSTPPPDVVDSSQPSAPGPRPRRVGMGAIGVKRGLAVGGAVLILGAAGWGAWAAYSFFQTGAQPAQALPAGTLGYVSVDLDPSGGQKIAALRTLDKFPAFEDSVGISSTDDVREKIFDALQRSTSCPSVDYSRDVEPWLGQRAALAAVDTGAKAPEPVVVLQVTDADKADAGLTKLKACGADGDQMGGWHIDGDWAVVAQTTAVADRVAAETAEGSLADDGDYKKWTGQTGDPGVVSMYAAPAAGDYLADHAQDLFSLASAFGPGALGQSAAGSTSCDLPSDLPTDSSQGQSSAYSSQLTLTCDDPSQGSLGSTSSGVVPDETTSRLRDFQGLAATIRFSGGSVELSVAGSAGSRSSGSGYVAHGGAAQTVQSLPADVGAAFGIGLRSGWFSTLLDQVAGYTGQTPAELTSSLSAETGLQLPGDAETLAGDSIAVAVGSDIDPKALQSGDTSSLPVAAKIHGDAEAITGVITKLGAAAAQNGLPAAALEPSVEGDDVAIGPDADFRGEVAKNGGLGEDETFTDVVPQADKADVVLYVDLDRYDKLLDDLLGSDSEVSTNLAPLRALGISSWTDGDVSHAEVRVSTN